MDSSPEFTLAQIVEMESIAKELKEESLFPEFCKRLASSFSCSSYGSEKPAITWKQVQNWFKDRLKQAEPEFDSSPEHLNFCVDLPCMDIQCFAPESSKTESSALDKLDCEKAKPKDLADLRFEARSFKDNAWYDVATFLNYRINYYGELEVRVRFSGFNNSHDEWVNVRNAVRERSIPLEPSECRKVNVGDPVLCFRERMFQAVYCDAHVVGIQRRLHDTTSCTCIFMVRYDLDNTEEQAKVERLCIRPT